MKHLRSKGIRFLFIICILMLAITPAVSSQSAVTLDKCYDQFGVIRTDKNSYDSDFCFMADKTLTYISYGEYKIMKGLAPALDGSVKLINNASPTPIIEVKEPTHPAVLQPTMGAPAQPIIQQPVIEQPTMEVPMQPIIQQPVIEQPTMEGPAQPIIQQPVIEQPTMEVPMQPIIQQPVIEQPTMEIPTQPIVEAPILEVPVQPIIEQPDEVTPFFGEKPTTTPIAEPMTIATDISPSETIIQPMETIEAVTEPTVEPMPEDENVLFKSVPLIGTITEINGLYPAAGEVYNTTNVNFVWTFDSVGVDTVPTAFTLTLDGVPTAVNPACDVDSCNTTLPVAAGNHTWFVTGRAGPLTISSRPIAFSVVPAIASPAKPVLWSPTGTVNSRNQQMMWYPAANANSYTLNWSYGGGNGNANLNATDESCKSGICSLAIAFPAEGDYTWTVTASNSVGPNATSDPLTFKIVAPVAAPSKPVLGLPDGSYTSPTVNFIWKPANNAVSYTVFWVSQYGDSGSKMLAASDASCAAGDCHVSDLLPKTGSYTWYVVATNSAGTTQSDSKQFTLSNQVFTPAANTPRGAVGNSQPFFYNFSQVQDNVYEYNVKVWEAYSNNQVADYYWNVSNLNCNGSTCTGQASSTLPQGYYYWKVRARTNNDISDWSAASHFNNLTKPQPTQPAPNTIPYAYSPSGLIQTANPIFSWRPITGAGAYWLTIFDAYGNQIYSTSTTSAVCNWKVCTLAPGFTLPGSGNYSWRIAGGSSSGVVWNASSARFVYQGSAPTVTPVPITPPASVTFLSPENKGDIYNKEARIVWIDAFDSTSSYKVALFDGKGTEQLRVEMDRKSAWCDQVTCTIEFETIPVNQNYRLQITPVSQNGVAGQMSELLFNVTDQPLNLKALYPMETELVSNMPIFSWRLPSETAFDTEKGYTYSIKLINKTRSMEATLGPFTCASENLYCYDGGAFLVMRDALMAGDYIWGVSVLELAKVSDPINFVIK